MPRRTSRPFAAGISKGEEPCLWTEAVEGEETLHPTAQSSEAATVDTTLECLKTEPAVKATRSFSKKHKSLYASERDCARYDLALCRCQDHEGNLLAAITKVLPLAPGMHAVDVGCGTGKLARLVSKKVGRVSAFDRASGAVAVGRSDSLQNITWGVADLRELPVADGSADLVLAGWALSYLKAEHEEWYSDGSSGGPWKDHVDSALAEIERVLVPGGAAVIFETLGTATEMPQRQGSWLYAHFRECGLEETWLRTDYRFPSEAAAMDTLTFFFGRGVDSRAAKAMSVDGDGRCTVPECTGIWWMYKRTQSLGRLASSAEGGGESTDAVAAESKEAPI